MKVGGALMVVLGVLMVIGVRNLYNKKDTSLPESVLTVEAIIAFAIIAGGLHFYRNGWQRGHDLKNVMSVLPIAVFAVILALGALAGSDHHQTAADPVSPPTDAYGYTEAERLSVLSGVNLPVATKECYFAAFERNVPHDEFVREMDTYWQTGHLTPQFERRITNTFLSSGC